MAVKQVALPPEDPNIMMAAWGFFSTIMGGMRHTMGIFFEQLLGKGDSAKTIQWPEETYKYSDRFKGKHFLTRREDGQIRCTACFLCATNCPAQCIHIEAGQHPDNDIEKFPVRFEIDILRCVFCGFCEEACPVDAIRLGPEYTMAGNKGEKWVYTKDYLADRAQLQGGITSIKDENVKIEGVNQPRDAEHYKAYAPHGGQHHPH